MLIGKFNKLDDGRLVGRIRTLTIDAEVEIQPQTGGKEGSPQYRAFIGEFDIGAGWVKKARESGNKYVSLLLDCPSFSASAWATLIASSTEEGAYDLMWKREDRRGRPSGGDTI